MIPSMVKTRHLPLISLLLRTSLILGACANKAKMIQVGATQFEAESLAVIERITEGVIATDEDVTEVRRIRAEVDQAATTQTLIEGAIRVVAFIAKCA